MCFFAAEFTASYPRIYLVAVNLSFVLLIPIQTNDNVPVCYNTNVNRKTNTALVVLDAMNHGQKTTGQ